MDGFAEYSDSEGEEGGGVDETLLPPAPVALAESDDEDDKSDEEVEAAAQAPAAAAAEPVPQEPAEKKRKLLPNPLDAMSTVCSHRRTQHPDPQRGSMKAWRSLLLHPVQIQLQLILAGRPGGHEIPGRQQGEKAR